jgi:hypothetical protein
VTPNQRSNALAMLCLTAITPAYVLLHPLEMLANWRNGR